MSVLFHNLVRGVIKERSKRISQDIRDNKEQYLRMFKERGYWLQDAVPSPIQKTESPYKAITKHIGRMHEIIQDYHIESCVLIKKSVYKSLGISLGDLGVNVLNSNSLVFPSHGWQAIFRKDFGQLLITNGYL